MAQNELSTTRTGYDGDRNACMLPHCSLDFGAIRAFVGASEAIHVSPITSAVNYRDRHFSRSCPTFKRRRTLITYLHSFPGVSSLQTPARPYHRGELVSSILDPDAPSTHRWTLFCSSPSIRASLLYLNLTIPHHAFSIAVQQSTVATVPPRIGCCLPTLLLLVLLVADGTVSSSLAIDNVDGTDHVTIR
ncbi:hypothetical protein Y032_0269g830 [Ancylostoma ceylanicum]|uniref:Uncharacterized protein n=1 Tax=Ancylostoma ceylanicum TaxID=53326 RepID=A0A016S9Q2_9BILA|nr:hypothetical protein Y032_0269g830 [Ancylostoma ceylanicum]